MRLAEVLGHQPARQLISRLISVGRLPHALIIEGPAGVGRRTLALATAQALLCPHAAQYQGDSCGECDGCRLVASDSHPDLTQLPGESEQTTIPVDMVREQVVDPAGESPLMGNRRVFVLPAIERLRGPAANALLKVLEEPPEGVHFIMTAGQAGGLLATIQSRAQVLRLLPLSREDLNRVLMRGGMDMAEAQRRTALSGGSHRGLWSRDVDDPPLRALRDLVAGGYDPESVAEVMDRLPATASDVPKGATVAGEQRRILTFWLAALIEDLRRDLRGPEAVDTVERIERVLRLRGDLGRYIQPRLIIEGLGLA